MSVSSQENTRFESKAQARVVKRRFVTDVITFVDL